MTFVRTIGLGFLAGFLLSFAAVAASAWDAPRQATPDATAAARSARDAARMHPALAQPAPCDALPTLS
jgi:hypothetical protein